MLFAAHSTLSKLFLGVSLLVAGALRTAGRANLVIAQEKVIKKTGVQRSDASSDKAMFTSYCAACHGPELQREWPCRK